MNRQTDGQRQTDRQTDKSDLKGCCPTDTKEFVLMVGSTNYLVKYFCFYFQLTNPVGLGVT